MNSAKPSAITAAVRFLLLWMIVPTFFRLLGFVGMMSLLDTPWRVLYVGAWAMGAGVPQDLFVALQCLALTLLVKGALCRVEEHRRNRLLAAFATSLFGVVQLYLLVDYILYLKTGLRMDCSLLDFLPAAKSFTGSAREVGLGGLVVGLTLLVVSLFWVHRLFARSVGSLRFSVGLAALLPLVAFIAVPSREAVPAQLGYSLNNLVLNDQCKLVINLIDPGLSLSSDNEAAALALLTPQAESFERVSPEEYPLLKRTLGFHGEKTFDVRIGPGERPHVVFLFMESFRARDVGVLGGKHNVSPNFDKLSKQGVLFTNFYSNGVQTTRGLEAGLFGILPRFSVKAVQGANCDMPLIGVADLFRRRDYRTAYFYGGDLGFENQYEFLHHHNYQEIHGEDNVCAAFPNAERTSWGYHDEFLLKYLADWLAAKDRNNTPGCAVAFTISNHHPFQVPDHFPLPECHVEPGSQYARYLQTFAYADHSLGLFCEDLRRRGLDRKTVLFILGDHGFPMGEHFDNVLPMHNLYDENVHVPLLILAPGRIDQPAVIHDVSSQVDLLPTVMDMFGMTGLNHAVGTTLMRRVENRTAYFNSPFVLQYLGLRRGNHKYFYTVKSRTPAVFDLTSDPDERTNIAPQVPGEVDRYHEDVTLVNQMFLKLYVTGGVANDEHVKAARAATRGN
jgi:phosphoglycerol transferase MdoB-like AlkP superfamily enzyme